MGTPRDEALRKRERQLAESQRVAGVGSFEWVPATGHVDGTDEMYRIYGIQRPAAPPRFEEDFLPLVHRDDRDRVVGILQEAFAAGQPFQVEHRIVRPGGEVRVVEERGEVVLDAAGRPATVFGTCQDITERRKSEDRLHTRYEVTRILAEATTVEEASRRVLEVLCAGFGCEVAALWLFDEAASGLRCKGAFSAASADASEFVAESRRLVFPRGDTLPGRVLRSGQPAWIPDCTEDVTFVRRAAARQARIRGAYAFPVLIDGKVDGVFEMFRREREEPDDHLLLLMADIGRQLGQFVARRRAEKTIQESEARFRSIFESAGAGMAMADEDGRYLQVNHAFARFLGYTVDELRGKSALDVTHPDHREETRRQLEEAKTGQRQLIDLEKRYLRKDGSVAWAYTTVVAVPGAQGGSGFRFGIIQDITERKRAEEALEKIEARYATLFHSSMDAIFIADGDGGLLALNPAARALFGLAEEDVPGFPLASLYCGAPQAESFMSRIARDGAVRDLEVEMRRWDGARMDCVVTASAPRDDRGRVARYEGIVRDVTEKKRTDRELRDLYAHLLRAQDDERRRIARELHDSTGQDLVALAMNLAVVLQDADHVGERGRQALRESEAIAARCAKDLRTMSYLLHPPLLDEMGLAAALRWLAEGFQARSGVFVSLHLRDDLGRLGIDRETAIFRVVQEALTNVHRHSGSARARVRLAREGHSVLVAIEDDGNGLPEATRKEGNAGLGVGIIGMRERVRQLGGRLEIVSGPRGTMVRAVLPLGETG